MKTVIEMAREAGASMLFDDYKGENAEWCFTGGNIEKFAALVRAELLKEIGEPVGYLKHWPNHPPTMENYVTETPLYSLNGVKK